MRQRQLRIQACVVLLIGTLILLSHPGASVADGITAFGGPCIESCFIEASGCEDISQAQRDAICQQYSGCGTQNMPLNACDGCTEVDEELGFWCEAPDEGQH